MSLPSDEGRRVTRTVTIFSVEEYTSIRPDRLRRLQLGFVHRRVHSSVPLRPTHKSPSLVPMSIMSRKHSVHTGRGTRVRGQGSVEMDSGWTEEGAKEPFRGPDSILKKV